MPTPKLGSPNISKKETPANSRKVLQQSAPAKPKTGFSPFKNFRSKDRKEVLGNSVQIKDTRELKQDFAKKMTDLKN